MLNILFSATYSVIDQVVTMPGVIVGRGAITLLTNTDAMIQACIDPDLLVQLVALGCVQVLEDEADEARKYDNPNGKILGASFDLTPV